MEELKIIEIAIVLLVGVLGYMFREQIKLRTTISVLETRIELKNTLLQETRDNIREIYRAIEQIKICLERQKRHE